MRLEDPKGVYDRLRFERAIQHLQDPVITALPDLSFIQRGKVAGAARAGSEIRTVRGGQAARFFRPPAGRLERSNLPGSRMLCVGACRPASPAPPLPVRAGVEWQMSLQEMQRQFGKICPREPCTSDDHYAMARCLGVFSRDQPEDLAADGTSIAVLGLYHCSCWPSQVFALESWFLTP